MATPSSSTELRLLVNGFQVTQSIAAAVELGIPDLLADGPRSSDELAAATDAHAPTLYRLLRALASVGVLHEDDERRFTLTELGGPLRSDADEPLAGWVRLVARPYYWRVWSELTYSVRTGEPVFARVHGQELWDYRAAHPEESAIFDEAMTHLSRRANRSLLEAYDFGRFGTIVDVGGGRGAMLAALLAAHPSARGILFDLPYVVDGAAPVLDAAGVAERCEVVGGSFFDGVPSGGDAYVLKSILHDWDDAPSQAILERCREAGGEHATLLVLERILGGPNEDREAKHSDLNMLIAHGGRERTLAEWEALLAAAGFRLTGTTPTASGYSVIEAVPA